MSPLLASVIIPTRGRNECLRQTLRDLASQNTHDFDVWVVDQNEPPLNSLESEAGTLVLHHEKMPPLGSHAGRNYAIFRTAAPLCIFVDDDVRLKSDFIATHLALMEHQPPSVAAIAGRVVQPRDGFTEEQMRAMEAPARYNRKLGLVSGNFVGFTPSIAQHIHECNFSMRTDILRKIGGFSEEFRGNAYFEGADLALRVIEAGFSVQFEPSVALIHLQDGAGGNRVQDKARHTYWYQRNYCLLNSQHMSRAGIPFFLAYSFFYVVAKAAKNLSPRIALQGLRGILDGLSYFFHL